jgi:hypothetical protein
VHAEKRLPVGEQPPKHGIENFPDAVCHVSFPVLDVDGSTLREGTRADQQAVDRTPWFRRIGMADRLRHPPHDACGGSVVS